MGGCAAEETNFHILLVFISPRLPIASAGVQDKSCSVMLTA